MSARLVRTATYKFLGRDGEVQLKKWSVSKFLTLFEVIGEVLGKVDQQLSIPDAADTKRLGGLLVILAKEAPDAVVRVVGESVDGKKPSKEEILEWDAEDLLGVLDAVLRLNFTEDLGKNGQALRANLFPARRSS